MVRVPDHPHPTVTRRGLFVAPFDALAEPVVLAELAVDAERVGWDGFFVWDHLLYSEPVAAIADPWISCAAVAAATSRILLGPMVTPLSRRRVAVLARQAVSLDRLSGGRLVLGFGLGDDGAVGELSRFGEVVDARTRAAMLDEGLDVLRELLSGNVVERDGPHAPARGVRFLPTPVREAGIPIWIGGRWPHQAPLRRAARFDGAFVIGVPSPDELTGVAEGLPGNGFDLVVDLPVGVDPQPWAAAGATWVLTRVGPHDINLERARALVRAGPDGLVEA
jgi:alkanesulfonate monooxygenase SsuD/methylene tetrahydromethanopterin reductase-like flavin-dependent oxidoreductase (luciferase family)